jgi:hypothetical protein
MDNHDVDKLNTLLKAAGSALTVGLAATGEPVLWRPDQARLLTRNRYRITAVERRETPSIRAVEFRLEIAGHTAGWYHLTPEEFTALTEDLGMLPTSPEATEYESTRGRRKP